MEREHKREPGARPQTPAPAEGVALSSRLYTTSIHLCASFTCHGDGAASRDFTTIETGDIGRQPDADHG